LIVNELHTKQPFFMPVVSFNQTAPLAFFKASRAVVVMQSLNSKP